MLFVASCFLKGFSFRNELLAEYPELASDIEEEIRKLEEERDSKQAHVDALQAELEEAETKATINTGKKDAIPFVASSGTAGRAKPDSELDGDSNLQLDEVAPDEDAEADSEMSSQEADQRTTGTEIQTKNDKASKEDLSLQAIGTEIIRSLLKQAERDIRRIIELMTPALKPLLRVGSVAWRQLRSAADKLRTAYDAQHRKSSDANPKSEEL